MEPVAQVTPKKSRRLLWIGVAALVALLIVAGIVAAFVIGNPTKKETAVSPSPSPAVQVATKEEVKQNLQVLDDSLKQANQDQATAKSAIQDAKQQVKLSE